MVKSAFTLLQEYPTLFKDKPLEYDKWAEVYTQASRHNERTDSSDLFGASRPLEEPIFTEYRNNNKRHITIESISKYLTMLTRTFSRNEIAEVDELAPEYREVLSDNLNFDFNHKQIDYNEFKNRVLLPLMAKDPNAVIIDFPYNPEGELLAPIEMPDTVLPSFKTQIINSYKIFYKRDGLLAWKGGMVNLGTEKKPDFKAYFFMLDDDAYWIAIPQKSKEHGVTWIAEPWYTHGLGYTPYADVPSRVVDYTIRDEENPEDTTTISYRETFLWAAYENLDQVILDFSNSQVSRIKTTNSLTVIRGDLDCPECNGHRVIEKRMSGFMGGSYTEDCHGCGGTGKMEKFGQFSRVKVKQNGVDDAGSKPVEYIQPPFQNTQLAETFWEKHKAIAESCLYIDPLEGKPNESGVAKEMRLQPQDDSVKNSGDSLIQTCEDIINNKLGLLVGSADFEKIKFRRPHSYKVKSIALLTEEMKNCYPLDRRSRYMEIKRMENSDPNVIRKWDIITKICPLVFYDRDEIREIAIGTTAYDESDIVKRDFVECAIDEITTDRGFDLSYKEYAELVDEWMIENGKVDSFISEDGEEILEGGGNSGRFAEFGVGGTQGLIGLSSAVANGEMTEQAAENIIIELYGFDREKARSFIDLPSKSEVEGIAVLEEKIGEEIQAT